MAETLRQKAKKWFLGRPRDSWREEGATKECVEATGINRREACRVRENLERGKDYAPRFHVHTPAKLEHWAIFADEHHPYGNEEAQEIAHDYAATRGVDGVCLAGDFCDFFQVSHWKNDPLRMRFHEEIELCDEAIANVADMFKSARKVYIQGNHEMRMQLYLWSKAHELAGLPSMQVPEILNLGLYGFEFWDNIATLNKGLPPFQIGKLNVLHGHEVKVGASAVNLARLYYLKTHVNSIVAHHHQTQEYLSRKLTGEHEGTWTLGCLCALSEHYAPVTNWNHGFALVEVHPDGNFSVENKKIIEGRVL